MTLKVDTLTDYVGGKLPELIYWERRFLRRVERTEGDLALSVARGNGKSALCAAIAAAVLDGPLRSPRAEVLLVASSYSQGLVMFRDVLGFLGEKVRDRARWRVRDSTQVADIEHRASGARLRALGSNPAQMHGLRPKLVLADEPAQWTPSQAEACLAALRTGLGKHSGSRLIALGTRPAESGHWFARMLEAPGGTVYAARPGDPIGWRRTWKRANPSLDAFPHLEDRIRLEAKEAKRDPVALASFRALRLNLGTSDVLENLLLEAGRWSEASGLAYAAGRTCSGSTWARRRQ